MFESICEKGMKEVKRLIKGSVRKSEEKEMVAHRIIAR